MVKHQKAHTFISKTIGITFSPQKVGNGSTVDNIHPLINIPIKGGTGLNHMVTMARSKTIGGPYEANPANPVLTNANTTNYCRSDSFLKFLSFSPSSVQTLGHADLFNDRGGNW